MKKDEIYLGHIFDACAQIQVYIDGFDHQAFLEDRKTQDAVVRQLEIIGELLARLSNVGHDLGVQAGVSRYYGRSVGY